MCCQVIKAGAALRKRTCRVLTPGAEDQRGQAASAAANGPADTQGVAGALPGSERSRAAEQEAVRCPRRTCHDHVRRMRHSLPCHPVACPAADAHLVQRRVSAGVLQAPPPASSCSRCQTVLGRPARAMGNVWTARGDLEDRCLRDNRQNTPALTHTRTADAPGHWFD